MKRMKKKGMSLFLITMLTAASAFSPVLAAETQMEQALSEAELTEETQAGISGGEESSAGTMSGSEKEISKPQEAGGKLTASGEFYTSMAWEWEFVEGEPGMKMLLFNSKAELSEKENYFTAVSYSKDEFQTGLEAFHDGTMDCFAGLFGEGQEPCLAVTDMKGLYAMQSLEESGLEINSSLADIKLWVNYGPELCVNNVNLSIQEPSGANFLYFLTIEDCTSGIRTSFCAPVIAGQLSTQITVFGQSENTGDYEIIPGGVCLFTDDIPGCTAGEMEVSRDEENETNIYKKTYVFDEKVTGVALTRTTYESSETTAGYKWIDQSDAMELETSSADKQVTDMEIIGFVKPYDEEFELHIEEEKSFDEWYDSAVCNLSEQRENSSQTAGGEVPDGTAEPDKIYD